MALSVVRVVALCDDDLLVCSKAQIGKAPPRCQSGNEGTDNVASANTLGSLVDKAIDPLSRNAIRRGEIAHGVINSSRVG